MQIVALIAGTLLLLAVRPACALTIRGDELWRSNRSCPEGWTAPEADDSAWPGVEYPWYHHWPPRNWDTDPAALFFWGRELSSAVNEQHTCVRRHFRLDAVPPGPAMAHIVVDDDYDFYLNGALIRASDGSTQPEAYDVSPWLRAGDNVIAMKLIDHGGSMGALFSLTVPGLPDLPPSWFQRKLRIVPWVQFAAGGILLVIMGYGVVRLRRLLAPHLSRFSPANLALLITLVAVVSQALLATQVFWRGMSELFSYAEAAAAYPLAHWNWPAVAVAAALFLLLVVLCGAEAPGEPASGRRFEMAALTAILLLATMLRVYRVDSIPVGFYQDEASNGNDAFDLIQFYPETGLRVWSDSCGGRPTLFLYLVGVCVHLLGSSYLSLKIVPVLFGVAGVAAVYALGRVAFGGRVALWAAFFLAVSRWHIHYSRMAWEAICAPFFSTAGFALLLHGLRRERRGGLSLVAGAVVLSLGLYTYAAYRAIPLVAIAFGLVTLVSTDRDVLLRCDRAIGLFAAAMLATAAVAPLGLFAWREPKLFWLHYQDVSIVSYLTYFGTPLPWVHMLGKAVLSFNAQGDGLIRHNLPLAPHLDVITATVFLIGLATAVWVRRCFGVRLLWVWLLTLLGFTSLTIEVPHATRLIGLTPVAALFAALGTTRLLATLRGRAVHVVGAALVLAATVLNSYQYFIVEANDLMADPELDFTGRVLCEYMRQLNGVDVYWTPDIAFFADSRCYFLARGHYTSHELTLDNALNPASMHKDRPVLALIGKEFLDGHRTEIPFANNGQPLLNFPVAPVVQHDRRGRFIYFLYQF